MKSTIVQGRQRQGSAHSGAAATSGGSQPFAITGGCGPPYDWTTRKGGGECSPSFGVQSEHGRAAAVITDFRIRNNRTTQVTSFIERGYRKRTQEGQDTDGGTSLGGL